MTDVSGLKTGFDEDLGDLYPTNYPEGSLEYRPDHTLYLGSDLNENKTSSSIYELTAGHVNNQPLLPRFHGNRELLWKREEDAGFDERFVDDRHGDGGLRRVYKDDPPKEPSMFDRTIASTRYVGLPVDSIVNGPKAERLDAADKWEIAENLVGGGPTLPYNEGQLFTQDDGPAAHINTDPNKPASVAVPMRELMRRDHPDAPRDERGNISLRDSPMPLTLMVNDPSHGAILGAMKNMTGRWGRETTNEMDHRPVYELEDTGFSRQMGLIPPDQPKGPRELNETELAEREEEMNKGMSSFDRTMSNLRRAQFFGADSFQSLPGIDWNTANNKGNR